MSLEFPTFYLLRIGFENKVSALHDLEREIGASLTYNNEETNIFVGKVSKARRATMELKAIKVYSEAIVQDEKEVEEVSAPAKKRRKLGRAAEKERDYVWIDSDTASEDGTDGDSVAVKKPKPRSASSPASSPATSKRASPTKARDKKDEGDTVRVLKLDWYYDSVKDEKVLPMDEYLVYEGRRVPKQSVPAPKTTVLSATSILARARADSPPPAAFSEKGAFSQRHKRGPSGVHSQPSQKVHLVHQNTSEQEEASNLPPLPDYCNTEYCCQRPTSQHTPNEPFIALLKKIQRVRVLQCDVIGERAYNKAIASIAAYPYTITHVEEILRLPGCGPKYAALYQEWKDTGHIREVDDFESSEKMQVLNLFYGIHEVAGKTANKFYNNGWRDLQDIAEYAWETLNREQQVGVKYYDEFQAKIPRPEVEEIGNTVLEFANDLRPGFQMVICGGYRRGKKMCGDVDVILTHPDEEATDHFIMPLMEKLAKAGYIPHTLQISDRNSNRGQQPLEWKGGMPRSGYGFDSLDKALVVWQDPDDEDSLHRRVDIIISPWKTAGCAIVGWSGATMFERDIRRYCRKVLGFKFDSSGVRRLDDGQWVDLEGDATDLLEKEKRVFRGLGLEWREPELRWTDG